MGVYIAESFFWLRFSASLAFETLCSSSWGLEKGSSRTIPVYSGQALLQHPAQLIFNSRKAPILHCSLLTIYLLFAPKRWATSALRILASYIIEILLIRSTNSESLQLRFSHFCPDDMPQIPFEVWQSMKCLYHFCYQCTLLTERLKHTGIFCVLH